MKYIVVHHEDLPAAILFNEVLKHRDVAAGRRVHGAGFCNPATGAVWGRSDSLDVASRVEDAMHIKLAMELNLTPPPSTSPRPSPQSGEGQN